MDLLTDAWIPVRPVDGGQPQAVTLEQLLCGSETWQLCLPRDDMELAALQLLVCLVQVTWLPADGTALRQALKTPMSRQEFDRGIARWPQVFRLDHPEYPFMQIRGVPAKERTGMDKLLAGLTGATNCAFVNEPGQGEALCGGCAAIALFNQANNAPGFGGGFKSGLRGGAPVTTLIQATDTQRADLRTTLWLNVLTRDSLRDLFGEDPDLEQPPVWCQPIKAGSTIAAPAIGLLRGLFWQPCHIELCPPAGEGRCSGCGLYATQRYTGFYKAKFGFSVEGLWPHPHSPRILDVKKGQVQDRFLSFTTTAPSWTHLSRFLVSHRDEKGKGHLRAPVVQQCAELFPRARTHLIVGGYRNNQASILERRHDVMVISPGWQQHPEVVERLVEIGTGYRDALRKALITFSEGIKNTEIKGAGVAVHQLGEQHFYRRSEPVMATLLATLDFEQAAEGLGRLRDILDQLCRQLFDEMTEPYTHHPKLVRALAVSRRVLLKHLSALRVPQGGQNVA